MSDVRCERYRCGALMTSWSNGNGAIVWRCEGCERNKRGLCRGCPRRLEDVRAFWCRICKAERVKQRDRDRKADLRADPQSRRDVLAKQTAWRKTPKGKACTKACNDRRPQRGPKDDLDRLYDRLWRKEYYAVPANRARKRRLDRMKRRRRVKAQRERMERAA